MRCWRERWRHVLSTVLVAGLLYGCGGGETAVSEEPLPSPSEPVEPIETGCVDLNRSDLPPVPLATSFDDNPLYYQQWAIHYDRVFYNENGISDEASIHMDGPHNFLGRRVKVAVIDDALDITHEDLRGAVVATYDVATGTSDVMPRSSDENHGTEVTGVIAARNNDLGPVGVAPAVEIYFIRLPFPYIYESDIVAAFEKAKEWGVDVINCSWGSGTTDDGVRSVIRDVATNGRDGKGIIVIFSAGNTDEDMGDDESALPEVIGVGATNSDNLRASYSNYGQALDLMAPGGEYLGITTLDQMGSAGLSSFSDSPDYLLYDDPYAFAGTSASAPIVTGVVAQLLEANPNLTRLNIYDVLTCTADKIGTITYDENGFNPYYGYGKINANRALAAVR